MEICQKKQAGVDSGGYPVDLAPSPTPGFETPKMSILGLVLFFCIFCLALPSIFFFNILQKQQ